MKRFFTLFLLVLLFATAFLTVALGCEEKVDGKYLRIHIRANSDGAEDQEIKLVARDGVIEYLTPFLSDARNRREAERIVLDHKEGISSVVNETLSRCGFTYGCNVRVGTEFFDERTYGDLTLPEGYYRAVIVELGSGEGKNWWCVAFPPLCFTLDEGYKNMQYKSILYEIVKKYLKREGK
ncbi:MAG: stage II sporulation protein R [Clostridia bacterium]|nr:stage II sporulation protein R [Clostridia bacterium]